MKTESSHPLASQSQPAEKRRQKRSWVLRIAVYLFSTLCALAVLGALCKKIFVFRDARRYPPPGELHDVGGYRLHLSCTGEGAPTVILESGLCRDSLDWSWVQPGLSEVTRVCTYDRAGSGWSDPSPRPRTSRNIAQELHQLLLSAGIEGPLVLVGHSAGGSHVELFQHLYPESVAGMVLVDVAHMEARPGPPQAMVTLAHILRWTGAARWLGLLDGSDLPPEVQRVESSLVYRPHFLSTMVGENEAVAERPGDRRLVCIGSPSRKLTARPKPGRWRRRPGAPHRR